MEINQEIRKVYNLAVKQQCQGGRGEKFILNSVETPKITPIRKNIFTCHSVQRIENLKDLKSRYFVGGTDVSEYSKRIKRKIGTGKKTEGVSRKSYTILSNEAEEPLLTRDELLESINQREQTFKNEETISHKQTNEMESKISISKLKMKHNSYKSLWNENRLPNKAYQPIIERADKNRRRVEELQKYSLNSEKENIQAGTWMGNLRKSAGLLCQLRDKELKLAKISKNGLKLVASSKKSKEIQWIHKHSFFSYYEPKTIKAEESSIITRQNR